MGKSFNKGLSEDDKKEGLFKRLKNFEGKTEVQLQAIKDQGEKELRETKNIKKSNTLNVIDDVSRKNHEANKILLEVKKIDGKRDTAELDCTKSAGTKHDFNILTLPLKFVEKLFNYEITIDETIDDQTKLEKLIIRLESYKAKNFKKIEEEIKVAECAEFFHAREDIIDFFEKGIFPFKGNIFETKEEKSEKKSEEELKKFINNIFTFTDEKSRGINNDLFKTYFNFSVPIDVAKR